MAVGSERCEPVLVPKGEAGTIKELVFFVKYKVILCRIAMVVFVSKYPQLDVIINFVKGP